MRRNLTFNALVGAAVMCSGPTPASADFSNAIYDDAKGIIVELLTDEVAQAIVPNIVCYAGRKLWKPPPEVSSTPPLSDTTVGAAVATSPKPPPKKSPPNSVVDIKSEMFELDALYYYPQTLQRIYTRQFGALRTTAIHESAQLAGYQLYELLSEISDSTAAKSRGHRLATPDKSYGWADPGSQGSRDACAHAVRDKFKMGDFATEARGALDLACASPGAPREHFNCELAFALSSALSSDSVAADDHLLKAISAVMVEAINNGLNDLPVPPVKQTRLYERTILLARDIVAKDSQLDSLLKVYIDDAIQIVNSAQIKTAIINIRAAIGRIHTQWRLAATNGLSGVSLATFFETMAATAGSLEDLCDDKPSAICHGLEKLRGSLEKGQFLWPIVRAAAQQNLSEAANVAIRAIFSTAEATPCSTDSDPEASCGRDALRDFFVSFAQYVIEASSERTPTEVTRAALRTAAVQAIRSLDVGGGFDRRGWLQWHRIPYLPGKAFFYPEFGLRASWNSAYLNRTDTSLRYVATMNMLTFKRLIRFTESTYAAVHISYLDLLSPLSELATRKTAGVIYEDDGKLLWNVITPRIEIVYGIPALSKHLVVGAGVSARLVAPIKDDPMVETYRYRWIPWQWNAELAKHVEFGFVLKYVL